jgi:hypothetical protein
MLLLLRDFFSSNPSQLREEMIETLVSHFKGGGGETKSKSIMLRKDKIPLILVPFQLRILQLHFSILQFQSFLKSFENQITKIRMILLQFTTTFLHLLVKKCII